MASAARPLKQKRVPIRTCVVCRQQAGKRALTRIVRHADTLTIDASGKLPGRGAYLCDAPSCWERAASSDVLAKALRTTLSASDRDVLRKHKAAS